MVTTTVRAMYYRCPGCQVRLVADPDQAGHRSPCPACGHVGIVPSRRNRQTGVWIVVGVVATLLVGVGAVLVFKTSPPETTESPSPFSPSPPPAHIDRGGARSGASLTVAAVEAVAQRYSLAPNHAYGDEKEGYQSWGKPKAIDVWYDSPASSQSRRVHRLELWMSSDGTPPADRDAVMQMLHELWPAAAAVADALSPKSNSPPRMWCNQMRWIGGPPYVCGVNTGLTRVHVEYVGTRADIRRCEQFSLAYANVRVGWFRYLRASQTKVAQKLQAGMTDAEAKKLIDEEMGRIMWAFEHVCRDDTATIAEATHGVPHTLFLQPVSVPGCLPIDMQLELRAVSAAIASAARVAKLVLPKLLRPFNPYDYIYMAFLAFNNEDKRMWGSLANVEGWRQTWGKLPPMHEKAYKEIGIAAMAGFFRDQPKGGRQ